MDVLFLERRTISLVLQQEFRTTDPGALLSKDGEKNLDSGARQTSTLTSASAWISRRWPWASYLTPLSSASYPPCRAVQNAACHSSGPDQDLACFFPLQQIGSSHLSFKFSFHSGVLTGNLIIFIAQLAVFLYFSTLVFFHWPCTWPCHFLWANRMVLTDMLAAAIWTVCMHFSWYPCMDSLPRRCGSAIPAHLWDLKKMSVLN